MSRIVIVGAGTAGGHAAERLRELGYADEIVVLATENAKPYHRPALSKQFLTGLMKRPDLSVETPGAVDVTWRLATPVDQLDPARRVLHLPGGEELGYDGLIIATGVDARRLGDGVHGDSRVVNLRTTADAERLQRALVGNRLPVVVIGSGFTACEVASTLQHMGRSVTLVGRSRQLMGRLLGPELGEELTDLHRRHDVDLQLGTTVANWELGRHSVTVGLGNGAVVEAAAVVVAVGSVAGVSWLRDSGLPLGDGVLCDPSCHVSGFGDIVAAGDVANWPNLRFDRHSRRVEHWTNAIEMGRAAAESLLVGRERAKPFMPVPRFWSEQHGVRIQAAGMPALGEERISLGRSIVGFRRNNRLVGVVGFDNAGAVLAYTEELSRNVAPDEHPMRKADGPRRRLSFQQAVRAAR